MNIGFAMCGSFCTFSKVFPVMRVLSETENIIPIFSTASYTIDSRFGTAQEHIQQTETICGRSPLHTIDAVEPIGPKRMLDALIVAPCTGNTLAKLAHSIADTPVTMAVKSHLRNDRPVIIAISTNDALAGAAENIGKLLARRNYYFVPFSQDDSSNKPTSIVADFCLIPDTLVCALNGEQIQPLLKRN